MRRKNDRVTDDLDRVVKDIERQTRRRFSPEEMLSIVLAGIRGEGCYAAISSQKACDSFELIRDSKVAPWMRWWRNIGRRGLAKGVTVEAC